jgi:hypothetical protein
VCVQRERARAHERARERKRERERERSAHSIHVLQEKSHHASSWTIIQPNLNLNLQ